MVNYRIRDGLVIESICGTSLLIATLEARKHCPYVMQLNEASAYIWKMLFDGKSFEDMAELAAADFEISGEEARATLQDFLEELVRQNYLIVEESEDHKI